MTLTKNELRQLIVEEIDRQHLKQIIAEDMGDWNPLEILRTAGKYYLDLAKSDNPRQQFRKDLEDAGVDDILQGVSAVPFIGLPFGLASIGLNLAAGNTRKALIQVVATAGAAVGAKAVGAGFSQAAANPRVVQAAARLLNSVAQRMGGLPSIGPSIATGAQRLGKKLAEAMSDLAENAAENEIADAVEDSKAITIAVNKLSKSQAAKKIKGPKSQKVGGGSEKMYKVGGGFAANRKDSSLTNELYSNTEDSLREVRTVKISRSRIRKLVKESIKKSGIVLTEKMNRNNVGMLGAGDAARIGKDAYEVLRNGNEILLVGTHGAYKGQKYRLKLTAGKLPEVKEGGLGGSKMMFNYENIIANVDSDGRTEKLRAAMFGPRQDGFVYKTSPQPHFEKDGKKMKTQPIEFFVKLEGADAKAGPSIDDEDLL